MKRSGFLALLAFLALASASSLASTGVAVTASSVEALQLDLSSVVPPVRTPFGAQYLLLPNSALGSLGPLGSAGPLGEYGPIGKNLWNPNLYMQLLPSWTPLSRFYAWNGGPLSEAGPLGPNGPLNETAYWRTLPSINDFGKQLQAGGVWGVLGPLGPLGALGPLGPLGPMGAHGCRMDSQGVYRNGASACRTVTVPYAGKVRRYELFETYSEAMAKSMRGNDTSFMVLGRIEASGAELDDFPFFSAVDQWVTVLVVPTEPLERLDVALFDGKGHLLAASASGSLMNFIQLQVPRGTSLWARVRSHSPTVGWKGAYRLIVVGSGASGIIQTDIRGRHQLFLGSPNQF